MKFWRANVNNRPLALIIEDHKDQNMVFSEALEHAGYKTESIFDGAIAQERLKMVVPAVVILDLHMPGVNGSTLLGQIRSDSRLVNVTVMLATADAAQATNLQPQADIILLKPISFSQIMMITKRYLKKYDNEQSIDSELA
jgi:CheY-like chemotaxis protein